MNHPRIRSRTAPGILALLALLGAGPPPAAEEGSDPSADVLILRRCPLDYERSATMGSSHYGQIHECLVAPGDRVKAGQVLARLGDGDLRAEIKLREIEAKSDVQIRLNEARAAQAAIKYKTTQNLVRRNAASLEELNLHRMEAEAANLAIEQARHERELASVRLEQARSQLRSREFISPYDGVVISILKKLGEPVAPNEPVLKVVDTQSLLVTGQVDVTDSWRLRLNQRVKVVPEIAGADLPLEREVFQGRLVFVDSLIDPMSQTCKILVQVENRQGLLRAGIEVRVEIDPRAPIEPKAAAPAATAPAPAATPPAGTPTAGLAPQPGRGPTP
jgi:RND family efflux transporter MFP subunit